MDGRPNPSVSALFVLGLYDANENGRRHIAARNRRGLFCVETNEEKGAQEKRGMRKEGRLDTANSTGYRFLLSPTAQVPGEESQVWQTIQGHERCTARPQMATIRHAWRRRWIEISRSQFSPLPLFFFWNNGAEKSVEGEHQKWGRLINCAYQVLLRAG